MLPNRGGFELPLAVLALLWTRNGQLSTLFAPGGSKPSPPRRIWQTEKPFRVSRQVAPCLADWLRRSFCCFESSLVVPSAALTTG